MVGVDSSSVLGGLSAQVGWLGLRVGSRLALFCVHHMKRVNIAMMTAPYYYYFLYFIIIIKRLTLL